MSRKLSSVVTCILARQSPSRHKGFRDVMRTMFYQSNGDQKDQYDRSSNNRRGFKRALHYYPVIGIIGAWAGFAIWERWRGCVEVTCEASTESSSKETTSQDQLSRQEAVKQSTILLKNLMLEQNCPGLVITVTVDGKEGWSEGFGLADVENGIPCTPSTVMRIASISKSLTMAAVAKLWEEKRLDLDRPVQDYVPSWPEKYFEGEKVTITTRHLVSMLGGIRNYDKGCNDLESKKVKAKEKKKEKDKKKVKSKDKDDDNEKDESKDKDDKNKNKDGEKETNKDKKHKDDKEKKDKNKHDEKNNDEKKLKDGKRKDKGKGEKDKKDKMERLSDSKLKEFYLKKHWSSVSESLNLFKDDDLCCRPGSEYLYSTHTWTLVSAVVEGASQKKFPQVMKELFKDLGLVNTYLDEPRSIIRNRARNYVISKKSHLANAPYVDTSYKWAGGGLLSTSNDLCRFGNAMLYSFQAESAGGRAAGFLRPETVGAIWSPVDKTRCTWDSYGFYGMGWGTVPASVRPPFTREQRQYFSHTGGAVGASSVLLVLPRSTDVVSASGLPPRGVVVAIIVNMQSVSMNRLALDVAKKFERIQDV